jgi:hypothetical protein
MKGIDRDMVWQEREFRDSLYFNVFKAHYIFMVIEF